MGIPFFSSSARLRLGRQPGNADRRTAAQRIDTVAVVIGANRAGLIATPLIGGASIASGEVGIQPILVSPLGAVVLGITKLVRRGSVRQYAEEWNPCDARIPPAPPVLWCTGPYPSPYVDGEGNAFP